MQWRNQFLFKVNKPVATDNYNHLSPTSMIMVVMVAEYVFVKVRTKLVAMTILHQPEEVQKHYRGQITIR